MTLQTARLLQEEMMMIYGLGPQEVLILLAGASCLGVVVIAVVILLLTRDRNEKHPRDD